MTPQDLEDLLHRRSFLFSDSVDIQVIVDSALAEIASEGKTFVVTRIFTNTPRWLGRRVSVPDEGSNTKEIVAQYDDKMEELKLDFVFYYPAEVEAF